MNCAYVFRIYPNARQRDLIERTFGCCRWVYNRCLEMRRDSYERTGKSPTRWQLDRMLPSWKAGNPWLAEVDSHALQQSVVDLCRAYDNFFRRCRAGGVPGYPQFKSKRDARQSYRTNQGIAVQDDRHVKLPKLGVVRARVSRPVEGHIISATVKHVPSGKYFVCICCADCPAPEIPEPKVGVLGVDAGVHDIATCSDGTRLPNPRNLKRAETKLRREQRRLSRKKKGSANRAKQRVRVARVHEKVTNRRKDMLNKFTTEAVRESQAIAVEDLNVRDMMANHNLAKAVGDASMGEMTRQLKYKCAWYGRGFVRVGRFYPSSKICSACGAIYRDLTLSERSWTCKACGTRHDRDLNAAINIALEGARLLANTEGTVGHTGTRAAQTA